MHNLQPTQPLPIHRPNIAKAADNSRFRPIVECARLTCGLVGMVITSVCLVFAKINLFRNGEKRAFSARYWRLLRVHALQESKYASSALIPFLFAKTTDKELSSEWAISQALVKESDSKSLKERDIVKGGVNEESLQTQKNLFLSHVYVGSESPLIFAQKEKLDVIVKLLQESGITDHTELTATIDKDNRISAEEKAAFQKRCNEQPNVDPLLIAFENNYSKIAGDIITTRGEEGILAFLESHQDKLSRLWANDPNRLASIYKQASALRCKPLLDVVDAEFMKACQSGNDYIVTTLLNEQFLQRNNNRIGQESYLWQASHAGHFKVVETLIRHGVSLSRADSPVSDEYPLIYDLSLQYAQAQPDKQKQYLDIITLLLKKDPSLALKPLPDGRSPLAFFMLQHEWTEDQKIPLNKLYPIIDLLIENGADLNQKVQYRDGSKYGSGHLIDLLSEKDREELLLSLPEKLFCTLDDALYPRVMEILCRNENREKLKKVFFVTSVVPEHESQKTKMWNAVFNIARNSDDRELIAILPLFPLTEREVNARVRFLYALKANPTADPDMIALQQGASFAGTEMWSSISEQGMEKRLHFLKELKKTTVLDPVFLAIIQNPPFAPRMWESISEGEQDRFLASISLDIWPQLLQISLPTFLYPALCRNSQTIKEVYSRLPDPEAQKTMYSEIFNIVQQTRDITLLNMLLEGIDIDEEVKQAFVRNFQANSRLDLLHSAFTDPYESIGLNILEKFSAKQANYLLPLLSATHLRYLLSEIQKPSHYSIFSTFFLQNRPKLQEVLADLFPKLRNNPAVFQKIFFQLFDIAISSGEPMLLRNVLDQYHDRAGNRLPQDEKNRFIQLFSESPKSIPLSLAISVNTPSIVSMLLPHTSPQNLEKTLNGACTHLDQIAHVPTHVALFSMAMRYGWVNVIDTIYRCCPDKTKIINLLEERCRNPNSTATEVLINTSTVYRWRLTKWIPATFAAMYATGQLDQILPTFKRLCPTPTPPSTTAAAQPFQAPITSSAQATPQASSGGAQLSEDPAQPALASSSAQATTQAAQLTTPSPSCLGVDATDQEIERLITILQKHFTTLQNSPHKAFFHKRFLHQLIRVWKNHNLLKPEDRNREIKALLDRLDAMSSEQFSTSFMPTDPLPVKINSEVFQHPCLITDQIIVKKDFVATHPEITVLNLKETESTIYKKVIFLKENWERSEAIDAGGPSNEFASTVVESLLSGKPERLISKKPIHNSAPDLSEFKIPEYRELPEVQSLEEIEATITSEEDADPSFTAGMDPQNRAKEIRRRAERKQKNQTRERNSLEKTLSLGIQYQDATYSSLGYLFAQCYRQQDSSLVTGYWFHPSYFFLLQQLCLADINPNIFENESTITEQQKLGLLRVYRNMILEMKKSMTQQVEKIQNYIQLERVMITILASVDSSDVTPADWTSTQRKQAEIRSKIEAAEAVMAKKLEEIANINVEESFGLESWSEYKNKIRAALLIADGMKIELIKTIRDVGMRDFYLLKPKEISLRIQGTGWDFEKFKEDFPSYIFSTGTLLTAAQLKKGKDLFTRWLAEHTEEEAKALCATITGTPTHSGGLRVVFTRVTNDQGAVIEGCSDVHTCNRLMNLPFRLLKDSSFPNEEERYQALSQILSAAMTNQSYNIR